MAQLLNPAMRTETVERYRTAGITPLNARLANRQLNDVVMQWRPTDDAHVLCNALNLNMQAHEILGPEAWVLEDDCLPCHEAHEPLLSDAAVSFVAVNQDGWVIMPPDTNSMYEYITVEMHELDL